MSNKSAPTITLISRHTPPRRHLAVSRGFQCTHVSATCKLISNKTEQVLYFGENTISPLIDITFINYKQYLCIS